MITTFQWEAKGKIRCFINQSKTLGDKMIIQITFIITYLTRLKWINRKYRQVYTFQKLDCIHIIWLNPIEVKRNVEWLKNHNVFCICVDN